MTLLEVLLDLQIWDQYLVVAATHFGEMLVKLYTVERRHDLYLSDKDDRRVETVMTVNRILKTLM